MVDEHEWREKLKEKRLAYGASRQDVADVFFLIA